MTIGLVPRATRFPMDVPVHYRHLDQATWHQGHIENISRSGVLFRTHENVSLETRVELTFPLPRTSDKACAYVICQGPIVRTAPAASPANGDGTRLAVAIQRSRLARRPPDA